VIDPGSIRRTKDAKKQQNDDGSSQHEKWSKKVVVITSISLHEPPRDKLEFFSPWVMFIL